MSLHVLLENNRKWAAGMLAQDPEFFSRLERQQSPEYLWIGWLCELNVGEQVRNIVQCTAVQEAWERGQALAVHGWIYDLKDGLLRDMHVSEARPA
jgi:carbonic anhydrase